MALINERERAGENSEQVFEVQIRDSNEHDLPDVDGDDTEGGDGFAVEGHDETVIKVVNNLDVAMDVRLEVTNFEDGSFEEPFEADSATSVAAGDVVVLGDGFNAPLDFYRVVASTNDSTVSPGSGVLKTVFMNGK